jgi:hypothetical protein
MADALLCVSREWRCIEALERALRRTLDVRMGIGQGTMEERAETRIQLHHSTYRGPAHEVIRMI